MVKAQLLKLHPVVREMRPFDVIVSQSIGAIGESSFEFLYAIREVDNKAADYAGRLLATGLAVCVPVRAPGERLPISAGFRELVHQTKEALRRASYPTDSRGEAYVGNEGIRVSGAPIGAIDDGDSSAQDRQLMKDMLAVQLSGFKSPASSSAVSVEGNMLTMPGKVGRLPPVFCTVFYPLAFTKPALLFFFLSLSRRGSAAAAVGRRLESPHQQHQLHSLL